MNSLVSEETVNSGLSIPLIWCSSCKVKTENKDVTQTTCKGKSEDKVRVSVKALCAKCDKKKHTFHKSQCENENKKIYENSEIQSIREEFEENNEVPKVKTKRMSKKKTVIEEPRITLTLSQLSKFINECS